MSNSHVAKTNQMDKFRRLVKKCMKAFSITNYKSLYSLPEVRLIFRLFKAQGLADEMISGYPKMGESEERYREVLDSISEFERCPKLI